MSRREEKLLESFDTLWSVLAWGLFMLGVIVLPIIILALVAGPSGPLYQIIAVVVFLSYVAGYPCLVAAVVLVPTLALAMRGVRRRRASAVLEYLRQAFRLNLPLPKYLGAAARSEPAQMSRRLDRLRLSLEKGIPLAASLRDSVPELPDRSLALIEHAEPLGGVPRTLDRLIGEQLSVSRRIRPNRSLAAWYPPLLLLLAGAMLTVISIFIAPRFSDMFQDFGLPLPALTRWLFFSSAWMPWATIAVAVLLLFACGVRLREIFYPIRRSPFADQIKSRLLWNLPLIHGIVYDYALADLCAALADSVESGRSLSQAMLAAGQLPLQPTVVRRLERWSQGIMAGVPVGEAARRAEFPELFSGMIGIESGQHSLGEALRFLARYYADRTAVRRAVLRGVYLPIVTVCMGAIVATVAISIFLPMQQFTKFLAEGYRW